MPLKRILILLLISAVALCFSGCDLVTVNTEELLSPPELTGELRLIKEALESSVNTPITLKYPSSGEYRSPVILRDINGDGTDEAFAFYSTSDTELTSMNLSVVKYDKKENRWIAFDRQTLTGSGVEKVVFSDLDSDGTEEIVVGWEIYAASEKQLAIYSVGETATTQRMLERYTTFLSTDLDEDKRPEILMQFLDTDAATNTASLVVLDQNGVLKYGQCVMDGTVKTVLTPVLSTLSNGRTAVYFDEIKGVGAITEVIFFSKGELQNPLFDKEKLENKTTLRDSALLINDINNDGVLEIPIAKELINADVTSTEKLNYTSWCSFNGENFTEMKLSIINTLDGYRIDIPTKWYEKIAIAKNTEKRERVVYNYITTKNPSGETDEIGEIGDTVVTLKTVTHSEFNSGRGFDKKKAVEICRGEQLVYLAIIPENSQGAVKVTLDQLKQMIVPMQF